MVDRGTVARSRQSLPGVLLERPDQDDELAPAASPPGQQEHCAPLETLRKKRMRKRTRFATLVTAAFVVVVTAAWLFHPSATSSSDRTKPQQDPTLDARSKGDPDAPITVYEVSDFQCPYCRQFWEETLPKIDREYIRTGKLRLTFINFPLAQLHPNAPAAHEFAMCAAQQNRFWPVHDLLYSHQATWAKLDDPANYFMALADSAALAPLGSVTVIRDSRLILRRKAWPRRSGLARTRRPWRRATRRPRRQPRRGTFPGRGDLPRTLPERPPPPPSPDREAHLC